MITLPLSERGSRSHPKQAVFTKTDLCCKYALLLMQMHQILFIIVIMVKKIMCHNVYAYQLNDISTKCIDCWNSKAA